MACRHPGTNSMTTSAMRLSPTTNTTSRPRPLEVDAPRSRSSDADVNTSMEPRRPPSTRNQNVLSSADAATAVPAGIPLRWKKRTVSAKRAAIPGGAARIAVNVRFFQRQGLTAGSALAVGALDGFSGFIVEMVLLVGFLVLTPQSLHFDLSAPSGSGWRTVLLVLVGVAVVVAVVAALNPRRRNQAITWARGLIADGFETVRGLRSPRRLSLLIGGNLASDLLFAATLGLFAMAFGTRVPFPDLVVIIISVSLLAGLLPIPGGVGVAEGALTLGLVGAGMPEEPAFAAVLTYRLATFYIPPTWGFLALRWLERNKQL